MSQTILVRSPNWVGDAVMSLPFFASLKKNVPGATVVCLTRQHLVPLFVYAEGVDRVIPLDETAGRGGWRPLWRNAAMLRREQFDLGFCLPPSFGSALMLRLARIPRRIGHASEGRRILLTQSIPYGKNGSRPHRTEGYLALLDLIWPNAERVRGLRYRPGKEAQDAVNVLWEQAGLGRASPILAIGPGAAQPNKLWPSDRFAEVAQHWIAAYGGKIMLVGAAGDSSACDEVARAVGKEHVVNLAGAGNLAVAAEIIHRAELFVGNDSGLSHLAAAVGTPTVVISGPGDPSEVAPYSPRAVTVKKPLFCSPCYRNTCWRRDKPLECQDIVTVDDVWQAVAMLRERNARS